MITPPSMVFLLSQKLTKWYNQKSSYQRGFGNIFIEASNFIMDSPLIKFLTFLVTDCNCIGPIVNEYWKATVVDTQTLVEDIYKLAYFSI